MPEPAPYRNIAALTGTTRRVVYGLLAGVFASGLGWWILTQFFQHTDDFGMKAPSPLEPWARALHGAFAFGAVGLLGWLIGRHVPPGWRQHAKRPSGVTMLAVGAVLVLSGWLLYYAPGDATRQVTRMVHEAVGFASLLALTWHRGARRKRRRNPASSPAP